MYQRIEDALEVRLAGVKAAKAKLEEQINDKNSDTREPFSAA